MKIKEILQDAYNKVSSVCTKTYLQDRPDSVETNVSDFLVIRLPHSFYNEEIDPKGSYDYYTSTIEFDIYVRDKAVTSKPNTPKISTLSDKVDALSALIPFDTSHVKVTRPRVTLNTSDGNGFHAVFIQCDLITN